MKISNINMEQIVKHCLDEDVKRDLIDNRGLVISAVNKLIDNSNRFIGLEINNYDEIDIIRVIDEDMANDLTQSIDNFMNMEMDERIIASCPNLERMLLKISAINNRKFNTEMCTLFIDCLNQEIIYSSPANNSKVLDIFKHAKEDLHTTRKIVISMITDNKKELKGSIFGRRRLKNTIESLTGLVNSLDLMLNELYFIIESINDTNNKLLDLASDLFFELNSDGFSKSLK